MVAPIQITQSSIALKIPATADLVEGGLAVNVIDGALYSSRHDGSIIRIEGDTGNGTIASGASIALGDIIAAVVDVTGTTAITTIVLREGQTRTVRFTGALTLVNSATLVIPGGSAILTAPGDYATFRGYAAGIVRCTNYTFAGGRTIAGPVTVNGDLAATGNSTAGGIHQSQCFRAVGPAAATSAGQISYGSTVANTASAGANGAPPAAVLTYINISVNGIAGKIPVYGA